LKEPWSPPPALKVKELAAGAGAGAGVPVLPNVKLDCGFVMALLLSVPDVAPNRLLEGLLSFPAPNRLLEGVLEAPPKVKPVLGAGAGAFAKTLGCVFAGSAWGAGFPKRDEGAGVSAGFELTAGVEEAVLPKLYDLPVSCEPVPKTAPASVEPLAASAVLGGRLDAGVGALPPNVYFLDAGSADVLPKTAPASSLSGFFLFGAETSFFSSTELGFVPNSVDVECG